MSKTSGGGWFSTPPSYFSRLKSCRIFYKIWNDCLDEIYNNVNEGHLDILSRLPPRGNLGAKSAFFSISAPSRSGWRFLGVTHKYKIVSWVLINNFWLLCHLNILNRLASRGRRRDRGVNLTSNVVKMMPNCHQCWQNDIKTAQFHNICYPCFMSFWLIPHKVLL